MRVITWNCKMKFREDYKLIFPLKPDSPKSFITIMKTPNKTNNIDNTVALVIISFKNKALKTAVIIGAQANRIKALAAVVC